MSFKIGDVVKVVNMYDLYTTAEGYACKMNLERYAVGEYPNKDEKYKVIYPHFQPKDMFNPTQIMCAIENIKTKKQYIMGVNGVKCQNPQPQPQPQPTATECISEALSIVGGDRKAQYGNQKTNFRKYAKITNSLLDKTEIESLRAGKITDTIVCKVLMSIKLGRHAYKPKKDNVVDLIGYASILHELQTKGVQND